MKHYKYGIRNYITFELYQTNYKKAFMQAIKDIVDGEPDKDITITIVFNEKIGGTEGATIGALADIKRK